MNPEPGTSSTIDGEEEDNLKRTGSFRKILPGTSDGDSQLHTSIRMIDRPAITQNNTEYIVYLREYSILSEYNMLQTQDLRGVYIIPSAKNSFLWFGVVFIRQGMYRGGVFRFTMTLPDNFPDGECPKVAFQTKVFHPLIHPHTGELNTAVGFREWKKTNRVFQLVQFITKVLNKIDTKVPAINEEAAALLENNLEEFRTRAETCVKESLNHVYDPPEIDDPHYIKFTTWNAEIHEPIRRKIYEQKKLEPEKTGRGFSWVEPGSRKPLSKPDEPR